MLASARSVQLLGCPLLATSTSRAVFFKTVHRSQEAAEQQQPSASAPQRQAHPERPQTSPTLEQVVRRYSILRFRKGFLARAVRSGRRPDRKTSSTTLGTLGSGRKVRV